jgi:hypothetical protein
LPFTCTKERQRVASAGTPEAEKRQRVSWALTAVSQRPADRRNDRLTLLFPPVNRRVVGSNPTGGAISGNPKSTISELISVS